MSKFLLEDVCDRDMPILLAAGNTLHRLFEYYERHPHENFFSRTWCIRRWNNTPSYWRAVVVFRPAAHDDDYAPEQLIEEHEDEISSDEVLLLPNSEINPTSWMLVERCERGWIKNTTR